MPVRSLMPDTIYIIPYDIPKQDNIEVSSWQAAWKA